jgi:DNA polymerase-3 subunit gamma/tau
MGQALYRKYRSKSLAEIVGQEHITETLGEALKSGRLSHAYLFTGPRGVGKTSVARILAHEINGLAYTDDSIDIDIIEIDAASNRRIDEIRDLRDKVYIAPTNAKYKVYIIDEVHMLTKEAFNALLKTLEEPPAHAVFILATTEAHKLPETIISRTQRYVFRPGEQGKVVAHLREIADKEKIIIDNAALGLIAEHGEGSFRDSISLLDQAGSRGKAIGLEDIRALLGMPSDQAVQKLIMGLGTGDIATLLGELNALYSHGHQPAIIAKQLAAQLREQFISGKLVLAPDRTTTLLSQLINVPASHDPERYLEIVLLEALPNTPVAATPRPTTPASPEPVPAKEESVANTNVITEATQKPAKQNKATRTSKSPTPSVVLDAAVWPQVLASLKQKYNTLYGVVRMAQPAFLDGGKLELQFAFAFHQKRINEAKNRQIIGDIIKTLTGQDVEITCLFNKDARPAPGVDATAKKVAPTSAVPPVGTPLTTISNIFGGGELLES